LENDSSITAVIVACHHSPYTNSSIVSSNEDVQTSFVRPFVRSKKGKVFITGHAHTREHFRMDGKDFLVIGGGGGLQQPLKDTSDAVWIGEKIIPRQFFHFIRCELRSDLMLFQIEMLKEDGSAAEIVETINIPIF
ncbi:MAG: metallophosphoesterase family protein, partial [Bacteroidota bacterium]